MLPGEPAFSFDNLLLPANGRKPIKHKILSINKTKKKKNLA